MSTYYFVTFESSANRYEGRPKFKYLLPLDDEIAERIKLFQTVSDVRRKQRHRCARLQSGEAGQAPSAALQ